jgi:serine/threonine protein kinase
VLIGHTLKGRYRVYDQLGVGGAATVFLARDSETGQMVVVKLVHAHLVNDQFKGRFQREIDLLQQIEDPHIICLYDWALEELEEHDSELDAKLSYIIEEFVEGHTLADIIDTRAPLEESDALAIASQIAEGLVVIHSHGIVHRDIKSQNIMLTPENVAKIIDFGIAKGPDHATLTDPSHFAGTLYYAPPEQILGAHNVDNRADIYALGVVLYEMLTGALPIKDREFGTIATRVISGDLDPITGVSAPVELLVNDMLAHKVDDRISSAEEVVRRIEDIIGGGDVSPEIPERPAVFATIRADRIEMPQPVSHGPTYMLVTLSGKRIPIKSSETIIGRSHPTDPIVPDVDLEGLGVEDARTASRRHCRVFQQGDQFYIEDLGSMNGTLLNGQLLTPGTPYQLSDGDQIMTGRVVLNFVRAD